MKPLVFSYILTVSLFLHGQASDRLIYLGEADEGWQLFEYDFQSDSSSQLTHSLGDKRSPFFDAKQNLLYYRNGSGNLARVNETGNELAIKPTLKCADFVLLDNAAVAPDIIYTYLATGNPQRQFIWKRKVDEVEPELFFRPETGSMRQLALSPNCEWLLATHIIDLDTERVLLISVKNPDEWRYLTPEGEIAVYPSWSKDGGSIYYSKKMPEGNFSIWCLDLGRDSNEIVWGSLDGQSLFSPTVSPNGMLYTELRDGKGSHIVTMEPNSGKTSTLKLPHAAREPSIN